MEKKTQNNNRNDEPIAIITPYSPSKLPTLEMINLYKDFSVGQHIYKLFK